MCMCIEFVIQARKQKNVHISFFPVGMAYVQNSLLDIDQEPKGGFFFREFLQNLRLLLAVALGVPSALLGPKSLGIFLCPWP